MAVCTKCKILFETHEHFKSIMCSGPCSGEFHDKCTNLNDSEMSSIKLSTNIKWFCDDCSKSFGGRKNDHIVNIKDTLNSLPKQLNRRIKILIFWVFVISALVITFAMCGRRSLSTNWNSINATIVDNYVADGDLLNTKSRSDWLAQPSINDLVPLNHPIQRIIVLPTRTSECETQAACTYTVRITQTYNIESMQQDDIIYNFLIGGDGNVYEGRGWDFKGSILKDVNDDSISIAYIGSFKNQSPSNKQLNVTRSLLQEGIRLKKISTNYKIVGANQLDATSTATMADALYKSFQNWPHWSNE